MEIIIMNNSQYFAQYKTACEIIFASHSTDWLYLKDSEFKYQAMTSSMLEFIGMAALADVIDKTMLEIHVTQNESCHKLIAKFQKQDAGILKSQKRGVYLEVIPHEVDSKI